MRFSAPVVVRPTGRRIADRTTSAIAPEIEVRVLPGERARATTDDGSTIVLSGDQLRITGPVRDVLVFAGARPVQRRRGADVWVDLSAAVELLERPLFDPEVLRAAERADRTTGLRHRYDIHPNPPAEGEPAQILIHGDHADPMVAGHVRWWTGTEEGHVPLAVEAGGAAASATIPGHPEGTVVRYEITVATAAGGERRVADAAPDYAFHRPSLPLHRPPATTFSYRAGTPLVPEWWRDAIVYHLLVDRFAGPDGASLPGDNISLLGFAGGTIAGALARLDHVVHLGATAVLVSPLHAGDMHVCYDVTDHTAVDERLGCADDVRALCDRAHALGLRVVLDFEASYFGAGHPKVLDARKSPDGDARRWFVTHDGQLLGWHGGNPTFVPVDHSCPEARTHLLEAARWWLDLGVDGFRLDSAHASSFDFWTEFGAAVQEAKSDAVTIAEATREPAFCHTYRGRLTGYLDFSLEQALRAFASGELSPSGMEAAAAASDAVPAGIGRATFAECHDDDRLSHVVGGDPARIRLGIGLLLTLPGTPILYYGTEVGLGQPGPGDCDLMVRLPMPWDAIATPAGGGEAMLTWTTAAVAARRRFPALSAGSRVPLLADDDAGVWAFARTAPEHAPDSVAVVVAANTASAPATVDLDLSPVGASPQTLTVPPVSVVLAPGPTFQPLEL